MQKLSCIISSHLIISAIFIFALFSLAHPHCSWASLSNVQNDSSGVPIIAISPTIVDVGIVKPGESVQAEYIVTNKGTADLVIQRAAPS